MVKAEKWKSEGHKSQDVRCRIANRMTRIVFKMVSGRQLYKHPSRLDRYDRNPSETSTVPLE